MAPHHTSAPLPTWPWWPPLSREGSDHSVRPLPPGADGMWAAPHSAPGVSLAVEKALPGMFSTPRPL